MEGRSRSQNNLFNEMGLTNFGYESQEYLEAREPDEPKIRIQTRKGSANLLDPPVQFSQDARKMSNTSQAIAMNLTPPEGTKISSREPLQIIWRNLSYDVNVKKGPLCRSTTEKKRILHSMSGDITGGTITALMGPSGAGKSTLLNCISCKLTAGVDGEIFFRFPPRSTPKKDEDTLRIGFVPQTDYLFMQFTVEEAVLFASWMMNPGLSSSEHKEKCVEVLRSLDLEQRAKLKLKKLSGGQLKRASIAIEMISNPKILILDEPTSGLDSDNSEMVISMLKNLSSIPGLEAPAIVATIHQPSVEVFMLFDNIYLLNRFGTNIYFGPPQQVQSYMESFGFRVRTDINPADYMIEIANAKYGQEKFQLMADNVRKMNPEKPRQYLCHDVPLKDLKIRIPNTFFAQFWLLMGRNVKAYVFKSATTIGKLTMFMLMAMAMTHIFRIPVGLENGCWTQLGGVQLPEGGQEEAALKANFFASINSQRVQFDLSHEISRLTQGTMYFFVMIMFYMFMPALTIVMAFPAELKTVSKEISNSWYSATSYYLAKLISDYAILFLCMFPAIVYSYWASEQPLIWWRFAYLFMIVYLIGSIWQARGVLFSVIFNKNETIALLATLGLMYPVIFLSGFYVKVGDMAELVVPLTWISDMRRGFESMLAIMYGFNRCQQGELVESVFKDVLSGSTVMEMLGSFWNTFNVTKKDGQRLALFLSLDSDCMDKLIDGLDDYFGDQYREPRKKEFEPSYILSFYNVKEDIIWENLIYLIIMFWITQIFTYVFLRLNTRVNRL